MKNLLFLIIALFSFDCLAGVTSDQEYILNTQMGPAAHKVQLGTLVQKNLNTVVGKYSFAVQGGTSTLNNSPTYLLTDLNNKKSFVVIPKGAIITAAWVNTLTTPTTTLAVGLWGTGSASLGMSVQAASDLMSAREASTAFYKLFALAPIWGTSSTWVKVTADSKVSITINNNPLSVGKFNAYITYVLGD